MVDRPSVVISEEVRRTIVAALDYAASLAQQHHDVGASAQDVADSLHVAAANLASMWDLSNWNPEDAAS